MAYYSFNDFFDFDKTDALCKCKPNLSISIFRSRLYFTWLPQWGRLDNEHGFGISWLGTAIEVSRGRVETLRDFRGADEAFTPIDIYKELVEKREEMFVIWYNKIIENIKSRVKECERDYAHDFNDKLNVLPSIVAKLRKQNFEVLYHRSNFSTNATIIVKW